MILLFLQSITSLIWFIYLGSLFLMSLHGLLILSFETIDSVSLIFSTVYFLASILLFLPNLYPLFNESWILFILLYLNDRYSWSHFVFSVRVVSLWNSSRTAFTLSHRVWTIVFLFPLVSRYFFNFPFDLLSNSCL